MGSAQDNMIGTLNIAAAMQGGAGRDAISGQLPLRRRHPVHLTHPLVQTAAVARVTADTKLTAQELDANLLQQHARLS